MTDDEKPIRVTIIEPAYFDRHIESLPDDVVLGLFLGTNPDDNQEQNEKAAHTMVDRGATTP